MMRRAAPGKRVAADLPGRKCRLLNRKCWHLDFKGALTATACAPLGVKFKAGPWRQYGNCQDLCCCGSDW